VTDSGRLYYGWVVVAALSLTEVVSWGILYYGFPVLLRPMEADLGWSRVEITGAFSVGMGVAALAALPVGRWIDRHGARALMTMGSCLGTALLLVWSRVESLPAFYAVWCLTGLALAATLYEPAFAAVVGWFRTRGRDKALLTVTLAGALASTIFMPLEAWLVTRLGWRGALLALAVILAVITIPLHALILRPAPLRPSPAGADGAEVPVPGLTLGASVRMPVFWVLAVAFFVANFATISVTIHLIPYLTDRGYSPTVAAAMIGWMGAMQLPARLVFAPIAARFGHRAVTGVIFFVQAVSLAQLALAAPRRRGRRRRAPHGGARRLRARLRTPGRGAHGRGPRRRGDARRAQRARRNEVGYEHEHRVHPCRRLRPLPRRADHPVALRGRDLLDRGV